MSGTIVRKQKSTTSSTTTTTESSASPSNVTNSGDFNVSDFAD